LSAARDSQVDLSDDIHLDEHSPLGPISSELAHERGVDNFHDVQVDKHEHSPVRSLPSDIGHASHDQSSQVNLVDTLQSVPSEVRHMLFASHFASQVTETAVSDGSPFSASKDPSSLGMPLVDVGPFERFLQSSESATFERSSQADSKLGEVILPSSTPTGARPPTAGIGDDRNDDDARSRSGSHDDVLVVSDGDTAEEAVSEQDNAASSFELREGDQDMDALANPEPMDESGVLSGPSEPSVTLSPAISPPAHTVSPLDIKLDEDEELPIQREAELGQSTDDTESSSMRSLSPVRYWEAQPIGGSQKEDEDDDGDAEEDGLQVLGDDVEQTEHLHGPRSVAQADDSARVGVSIQCLSPFVTSVLSKSVQHVHNVIEPGEWRSTQPIVFGGSSLEAAAREVYNDPARRDVLIRSLISANERSDVAVPHEGESDKHGPTPETGGTEVGEVNVVAKSSDVGGARDSGDEAGIEAASVGDVLDSQLGDEETAVDDVQIEEEDQTSRLLHDFDLRSLGEQSESGGSVMLGEVLSPARSARTASVGLQVDYFKIAFETPLFPSGGFFSTNSS
jgi:hypothetical protein